MTASERFGIRQLVDCGAVSIAPNQSAIDRYGRLIWMRYCHHTVLRNSRWLVRFTAKGRARYAPVAASLKASA